MTSTEQTQYRLGVAYVAISALAWSSSGLFVRGIGTDLMTMLFCRGLVSGSGVMLFFVFRERGRSIGILRRMGWPSLAVMVFSATSMISGIGSMYYASIADAMVIYATVPFITAAVAFVLIGERPGRATLIASALALAGVLVMLVGTQGGGGFLGKLLAMVMTASVALLAVVMRRYREVPLLPAMAGSAWLCSFVTFWFASPFSVSPADIGLIITFGLVQNAMGLIFYTFGSQKIPAADASLLTALEVPFTPLWVWMFLGEQPGGATLVGGVIVLLALFGHIVVEVRRNRVSEMPVSLG